MMWGVAEWVVRCGSVVLCNLVLGCDIGRMCKWYGVVWCDVVWGNVMYDVGCGGMGGVMCWCGVNVE